MKKEYVKKDDYELYSFPMPFLLKRSRRKNYIAKKLEQLHPCFSDNCCYDAKYRLKKGKLMASVAVMDKVKLAEYRSGGRKHIPLKFGDGNRLEFFNSEKILNISLTFAIAALAGILLASHAIHTKTKSNTERQQQARQAVIAETEENTAFDKAIHHNIEQSYMVLDDFLQSARKTGGSIQNCSLIFLQDQNADQAYKMTFSMKECFPQDFLANSEDTPDRQSIFSAVSYANSKPEFSASLYGKASKVIKLKQNLSKSQIDDIRLSIWNCNGILLTDFSDEGIVEFLIQNTSIKKLLENLKNICNEHSIFPAAVEIEAEKFNSRMKIIFAEEIKVEDCNPLALINKYSDVFLEKDLPKAKAPRKKALTQNHQSKECFGKIRQKDGSVLVFYKNSQGKITGEKE
ncbi:MAG: hypothetical protein J6X11_00510 [Treponema sp.]|nr:hypothetical protein [Treponema sp.]